MNPDQQFKIPFFLLVVSFFPCVLCLCTFVIEKRKENGQHYFAFTSRDGATWWASTGSDRLSVSQERSQGGRPGRRHPLHQAAPLLPAQKPALHPGLPVSSAHQYVTSPPPYCPSNAPPSLLLLLPGMTDCWESEPCGGSTAASCLPPSASTWAPRKWVNYWLKFWWNRVMSRRNIARNIWFSVYSSWMDPAFWLDEAAEEEVIK